MSHGFPNRAPGVGQSAPLAVSNNNEGRRTQQDIRNGK